METQQTLFKQERLRSRNGRFCTKEQLLNERIEDENKRLRFDKEKYYRAWLAAAERASRLERELEELKRKINVLI